MLDIVADYTVSAIYLRPVANRDNKLYEEILKYLQEIEQVIEHLNNKYDGAENYLKSIGVSSKDIENIKANNLLVYKKTLL